LKERRRPILFPFLHTLGAEIEKHAWAVFNVIRELLPAVRVTFWPNMEYHDLSVAPIAR
jgi:hypothetical protein